MCQTGRAARPWQAAVMNASHYWPSSASDAQEMPGVAKWHAACDAGERDGKFSPIKQEFVEYLPGLCIALTASSNTFD
jgi:hypothetical protein